MAAARGKKGAGGGLRPKAQEILSEALKHPGIRDLMKACREAQRAEIAVHNYLAVYADSEQLVMTGVATAAGG